MTALNLPFNKSRKVISAEARQSILEILVLCFVMSYTQIYIYIYIYISPTEADPVPYIHLCR